MNALYAYNYYLKKGLPPHVAAGFVGNFKVESGFAPDVLAGKRAGDNGTAYGLAQWRGDRLANLNAYAKQRGVDWRNSLDTQLDFALEEFNPQSPFRDQIAANNYQRLMQTKDATQATHLIMNKFERAHPSPKMNHIDSRVAFANKIAGTAYQPVAGAAAAPSGIDMPGQAVQGGIGNILAQQDALSQMTAQQLAAVQAARQSSALNQTVAQDAAASAATAVDPFGTLFGLIAQQQQPPQKQVVNTDAITPQVQDVDPKEQTAMTSHTPNVYINRLRRRRA